MLWRPEREGRARAGWLRAGPASPQGGKAGGRAPRPLARSLAPSLRRWVSQSVNPPAAGEPASRRGPEPPDAGASSCHCSCGGCSGGRGSPGPGATGEERRRASGVGGAELSPRGRSWRPRRRHSLFVSSPPQAPGPGLAGSLAFALRRLRGWSPDAAGLRKEKEVGADLGEHFKVRLAVYF